MKFKIYAFKENLPELLTLEYFLSWQNISYVLTINAGFVLEQTKGKPSILVYDSNSNLIASGFFEFMRYFDKQGMKLI